MYGCSAGMYVCIPCSCNAHGGWKRALHNLGLRFIDGCEPSYGCWEEQPLLLSAEPFSSPILSFNSHFFCQVSLIQNTPYAKVAYFEVA